MTPKAIIALLVAIALSYTATAQNRAMLDSLERMIPRLKDSALVNVYSELAWQYRSGDRDKAIGYGNKAIALARKVNYQRGLAQAYNDMGILYFDKELYDSSIALYREALKIRERAGDVAGRAKLYNKIGIVYQKQGQFGIALENQLRALELFERTGDNIGISYSLNNIGILNQNMSRYMPALDYHKRSVAIKQKINDRNGLIQSYVNMANIYKILNDHEGAEEYYDKALEMSRVMGNKEYISNVQNNRGELYIRKKEYSKALQAVSESYMMREALGDSKGTVSCLNNLALIFIDLGKTDTAAALLARAEQIGLEGVNTKPELMSVYQTYSKLYEVTNDKHNSLERYKRYVAIKDTIYTEEVSEKFAELETRYLTLEKDKRIQQQQLELKQKLYELAHQKLQLSEADLQIAGNELELKEQKETILAQQLETSKKENAIQALYRENRIKELELKNQTLTLNRRNTTLLAVVGLGLMGVLLAVSLYRRYKLTQEAVLQATVLYQQELAAKAILEAEEKERQRIASDLHDTVGQMMSAVKMNLSALGNELPFSDGQQQQAYKKVLSMVDESCKEVRVVSHNIMPNALQRSGLTNAIRDLVSHIEERVIKTSLLIEGFDERLDANTEALLYRVVQESVNNVLKHANATRLDICMIKDDGSISITLEDNGKGFDTGNASLDGIGLKNILSRINYLKGTVEWSSSPGKGTLVAIHVPYQPA